MTILIVAVTAIFLIIGLCAIAACVAAGRADRQYTFIMRKDADEQTSSRLHEAA